MRTIDFLDKRVTGICNELKKLSVKQKFETSDWLIKPGNFLRPEDADADPAPLFEGSADAARAALAALLPNTFLQALVWRTLTTPEAELLPEVTEHESV